MDGTLTVAVHDFPAMARALGLPDDQPILEAIATLPAPQAREIYRQLDRMELEIAHASTAADGAAPLLETLSRQGARLGIVTRNSRGNALATLRACGLHAYFGPEVIVGREQAAPKPSPDGIVRLLEHWNADPGETVMVGDFLFDLQAGRAAGVVTIHVDVRGEFRWREQADTLVRDLHELLDRTISRVG
jgi:HAD superfamily hydrolase (TIGR01509 family)